MPIQTPQWTDFLICPICCNEYDHLHNPISLACGHTVCKLCLSKLQRKQCPYDQTCITIDMNDLPVNYALLQLVLSNNYNASEKNQMQLKLQNNLKMSAEDFHMYLKALKHVEDIALYLKPFSSVSNTSGSVNVLSRPMQRKLVMLINCQLLEEEGRTRALKAARSLGERTVTELIIQHQNPQQLSTNLWSAVRARGCQFLGPAMQEEVLKLVLLALEDGDALSRKVLVMFVVQRLEPHFPQASKTSIGHVVQLLYRASCFVVSKREGDSSLMKLKEEFRSYDALRREHDAQIVEIATEAGLRIAPDQWSALLYGDTAHKSHMQSIIDKLQNPQSFAQSVQELVIALQRTGDPGSLCVLRPHLEYLADIDVNYDFGNRIWSAISTALEAAATVVSGLVNFIKTHGCRKTNTEAGSNISVHVSKYKISLCRDLATNGACPRGINCTFAHSEEELTKYRSKHRKYQRKDNDNLVYSKTSNNNNPILEARGSDVNPEDCGHVLGREVGIVRNDCRFCKAQDFNSHPAFMPFNELICNSAVCTSNPCKVASSQYLVAMNYRKQQFITELQQALSDVQNQYSDAHNYDIGHPSMAYSRRNPESSFVLNNALQPDFRPSIETAYSQGAPFASSISLDKLNLGYNNYSSVIPDWNLIEFQSLASLDTTSAIPTGKEPPFLANAGDWNVNYSKLGGCNCGGSDEAIAPNNDLTPVNRCDLTDDVTESLMLESVKLHDQLRGLKKQITDIKDKTYEEGIVNDLRALEIRLECELAEEEEKLWPLQSRE